MNIMKKIIALFLLCAMILGVMSTTIGGAAMAQTGGIAIDENHFPDANFRNYVKKYDHINGADGVLSSAELTDADAQVINCVGQSIKSLKGIEYFTSLKTLQCDNNPLSNLDVSKNISLEILSCKSTGLSSIELGNNKALKSLNCASNQLKSLDVSQNEALQKLYCFENQLTDLDLSKNTALKILNCHTNQLSQLDVSQHIELDTLYCYNNQLTKLNVDGNAKLVYLYCNDNQLMELELTNHPILQYFRGSNQKIDLGTIPSNQYDLLQKNPNIVGENIIDPTNAIFNGTVMSNYEKDKAVTYMYYTNNDNNYMIGVTLTYTLQPEPNKAMNKLEGKPANKANGTNGKVVAAVKTGDFTNTKTLMVTIVLSLSAMCSGLLFIQRKKTY